MLLDLVAVLDLLASWTRNAFFWALLVDVLLKLSEVVLLGLGATIRTQLHPCLTASHQMVVQSIILKYFTAAMGLVWTPELKLVKHLFVEFVHLSRCTCELLSTLSLFAGALR